MPEFIDLVELGVTKQFNAKSSLYATAYYRHRDDTINLVNTLDYESNGAVIDSIYSPKLTLKKSFLDSRLTATLQWQNIDMSLFNSNE